MGGILQLFGFDTLSKHLTTKFLSLRHLPLSMEDVLLPTGSPVFDHLLRGYEGGVVTTVYGPHGSGKTTVCLLAALAMLRSGKKVIYVDSEGGFSTIRFGQLADKDDIKLLLDKLFLLKPMSFADQVKAIHRLRDLVNEGIGLVVVDSISMHYRIALHNHEGHRAVNAELSTQMSYLVEVARRHMIPILITSQVYADFDERDNVKMVGGDILRYGSKCLLKLEKYKGVRKIIVVKHRRLPEEASILFRIIEHGFETFVVDETVEKKPEKTKNDVPNFTSARIE